MKKIYKSLVLGSIIFFYFCFALLMLQNGSDVTIKPYSKENQSKSTDMVQKKTENSNTAVISLK